MVPNCNIKMIPVTMLLLPVVCVPFSVFCWELHVSDGTFWSRLDRLTAFLNTFEQLLTSRNSFWTKVTLDSCWTWQQPLTNLEQVQTTFWFLRTFHLRAQLKLSKHRIEDDFRTSDPSGSLLPSQFNDNSIQRDTCAQSGSLVTWKMDWGWPSGCNLGTWITFHFRSGFKVQQLNNFTKKGWQKVTCDTCIHAQTNVLFNFL